MEYMAKIDREDFDLWIKNNKEFNGRIMFQIWVKHLSVKSNFDKFLKTVKKEERKRTRDDFAFYKLRGLDDNEWDLFLDNCKANNMFGVDMINILIKRFNRDGFCVEVEVKI